LKDLGDKDNSKDSGVPDVYNKLIQNENNKLLKINEFNNDSIYDQIHKNTFSDYLGRKTFRNNLDSEKKFYTNVSDNQTNNISNETDKIINDFYNFSDEHQNLELKENTDPKANYNFSQIHNKFEKNSISVGEDIINPKNDEEKYNDLPNTRKNSDLFINKRFNDIFNLDSNFDNAEDMINFDCLSNGIFSNKEITFDENYNSQGEDLDKIYPGETKSKGFKDFPDKYSAQKNFEYNKNIKNGINLISEADKNNSNYNELSIKDQYKIINEKPFYEKKNMTNLKKFFNPNSKNKINTIKSIDDSTTVSTQFTKEKNSTQYSQSSERQNINRKLISESEKQVIKSYSIDEAFSNNNECKIPGKNFFFISNKDYLLEKEQIFRNKNITAMETYSLKSEGNLSKLGINKGVIIDYSNQFLNNNNYNIRFINKPQEINLSKDKNENNDLMSNVSFNLNCSNTSKEKNLNSFSTKNDFRKSFNKKDSQSNEIYKNLLATAKFFDLDG